MTDTRDDFERHFKPTIRQQKRHMTGDYRDPDIQAKWLGWQAGQQSNVTDAARWRALLNSARIRPLGCAGIREPEERHYAHLGLELWTLYGTSLNDEQRERLAKENALGQEWLIAYADIAELAQQPSGR